MAEVIRVPRLSPDELVRPPGSRAVAECALLEHLKAVGLPVRPVRWLLCAREALVEVAAQPVEAVRDSAWDRGAEALIDRAVRAALSGLQGRSWSGEARQFLGVGEREATRVWEAVGRACWPSAFRRQYGWDDPLHPPRDSRRVQFAFYDAWRASFLSRVSSDPRSPHATELRAALVALEPLERAWRCGLWAYWVTRAEVVAVQRPCLRLRVLEHESGRMLVLHSEDGPAVWWPGTGEEYYFFEGVQVPWEALFGAEGLTPTRILRERNAEARRIMIHRYGLQRFLAAGGARKVAEDDWGTLWRLDFGARREAEVYVEVHNATPEPDGRRRTYLLRVPPDVRSPYGAVSWTFAMGAGGYRPLRET